MFGRTKPPRPTVDELRAQPATVSGWTSGPLQAAVTWPPAGERRLPNPLLLLGHPGGWDLFGVDEVVDLDARRTTTAESVHAYRTCFVSDVAAAASDSEVGDLTRGVAPDAIVVVGQTGEGGPRQPLHLHATTTRTVVAHLAAWAAGTAAAGGPR